MASPSSTQRFRLMAAAGLRMIMHLHRLVPQLQKNPDLRVITCLASFTDLNDPWVSAQSYDVAQSQLLLQVQALTPSRVTSLINSILREVIKPVFAKSRSTAITETGRKSIAPLARSIDHSDSEVNAKPWKFRDVYIITVFKWLLSQLDVSS